MLQKDFGPFLVHTPFGPDPPPPSPPASERPCVALTVQGAVGMGPEVSHLAETARGVPPPPCISYALVQATAGVGTVLIWYLI